MRGNGRKDSDQQWGEGWRGGEGGGYERVGGGLGGQWDGSGGGREGGGGMVVVVVVVVMGR